MDDRADYNLQNVLTNLAVRVGDMEGQVKAFREQWRDQDAAAAMGRRVTHEGLQLLSLQVERLANDIMHMQQDLAELRNEIDDEVMPSIRSGEFAAQRKAGARGAMVTIWGGFVILISALAYAADKLVQFLWPKP